jgi:hypothetical protein
MRRVSLAIIVLIAACVLLWIALPDDEPDGPGRPERTGVPDAPGEVAEADPPAAQIPDPEDTAPAVVEADDADDAPIVPGGPTAHGTLLVVDGDGLEHPVRTGKLTILMWKRGGIGHNRTVDVTDGAWSIRAPEALRLVAKRAMVGEAPAIVVPSTEKIPLSAHEPATVRVRLSRPTILRVVDAVTGLDLLDITLVLAEAFPRDHLAHPGVYGEEREERRSVSSPTEIALPGPRERWQTYLVGSPGYAWQSVKLDRGLGGERRVLLSPGGGVDVKIAGPGLDRGPVLRLSRADAKSRQPVAEVSAGKRDRIRLDGLLDGWYRVAIELGKWFKNPRVLAETEVEITFMFVVKPPGLLDLRLQVPPPGRVVVTVLDDATGQPAAIDRIGWRPQPPEFGMSGGIESSLRDPDTDKFTFRAPQGAVAIWIHADGYFRISRRVTVGPGVTEIEVRARPTGGTLDISVRDGDAAVPWDDSWPISIERVGDGKGRIAGRSFSTHSGTYKLSHEGLYRVTFPKLHGYEAVPAQEVRLTSGKKTRLVIRLLRSR